jgi:hypothetical protein
MAFDYGVPEGDMKSYIGGNLKYWPTEGECTGLVDADAIPYVVGYTSTQQEYLKFKRALSPMGTTTWKDKCDHANYLLNSWLSVASCDSALLYLTDRASNFRNQIGTVKDYKGQRKAEKPPFFYEIKQWLIDNHGGHMSVGCEADDDISKEAWRRHIAFADEYGVENLWTEMHKKFSGFVIISKDKDLKIIPGSHRPPDSEQTIWVDPIGWLEPRYKETEINAYEYWPTFDGKAVNPKHLFAMVNFQGKIQPRKYVQLKCPKQKWEQDYVWYSLNEKAKPVKQDVITRGPNKGKGKYKRIPMGRKKSNVLDKLGGAGLSFFYAQMITGDSVDNYLGLPGYGPKKAYEILLGASTEQELCERVSKAYLEHYRKPELALERMIEQGQLAHMQTKEGELWQIPKAGESSFPI